MKPATKNIVLGAGYVYFDEHAADGSLTGERYLAETPGFSLTVASESLEDYSSDGPIAEKHMDVAIRVTRDAALTLKDMSTENFAIFLIAQAAILSTTAGAVEDTPINAGNGVQQGRWYQLGVNDDYPTGVRQITGLVVHDDAVTPNVFTLDDDYEVDLELARIYIVPGGGIANDTVLQGDFNRTVASWDQVSSNDLGAKTGALRYVAHNTRGQNRDLYLPDVVMKPDGEFAFKSRDTVQQMGFAVSVNTPGDGRSAVYLNGRPV
ncbi:MAG TPA: hypothetical protein PK725_12540 [Rhodocyclaceae bacterium]|nr:hypothetical protein [Rhodocyclaceae bacterium]